jgi:uncharacterized protein YyaL (SSP411 family)
MEPTYRILWHDWNEDAFRRAQEEDKPILLSISALWCHWCHVMDNTTYSDKSVIEIIEKEFVPIRVNTDMRPDINERYNMGGWPSTVFLTPTGDIITGGTYIQPELMVRILQEVAKAYREKKEDIISRINIKKSTIKDELIAENCEDRPVMNDVEDIIIINFDREYGGFGTEPKFPQIDVLLYALRQGFIHDDKELLEVVEISLNRMAESKTYDHIEGGFFRYATKRNWTEPHYEKMLEDNAGFLRLYTEAYQVFGYESYKNIAEDISSFLLNILYDNKNNYFYGSIDADERYYLSDAEERKKAIFPSIDRTMYTNWNAETVDALIYSGSILKKDNLIQTAFDVLRTIIEKCFDSDGNVYHYVNGEKKIRMLLTDIYSVLKAYFNAYCFSGDRKYIDLLLQLLKKSTDTLWHQDKGGFFDRTQNSNDYGELSKKQKPFLLNSKIAELLALCSSLLGDERWRKMAEVILDLYAGVYKGYSIFSAVYAGAFFFTKSPSLQLNIIGKVAAQETTSMLKSAYNFYYPGKCLIFLDPEKDKERIRNMGFDSSVIPVVYPCEGRRCFAPIKAPSEFNALLIELKK